MCLDYRMMHLFSIIAEQVQNKQELFTKEEKILDELLSRGFHLVEADTALMLMQNFALQQDERFFDPAEAPSPAGMRTMTAEERRRFTPEAFGFLLKLAAIGIITESQREALTERAMAAAHGRIDLDHVKDLVTIFLFTAENGHAFDQEPLPRRIDRTSWN